MTIVSKLYIHTGGALRYALKEQMLHTDAMVFDVTQLPWEYYAFLLCEGGIVCCARLCRLSYIFPGALPIQSLHHTAQGQEKEENVTSKTFSLLCQ